MASEQQQLSGNEPSIILPTWWEWTQEVDLMISAADPAIVRQSIAYGLNIFPEQSVYPPDDERALRECSIGSIQSRILLEAAQIALRAGIRRVVWPVRVMRPEMDLNIDHLLDEIAITVDRALLSARLGSLDASESTGVDVVIETPFVDLSNEQMVDLVGDLALPIDTCWWHDGRTLPHAQERYAFWAKMRLRSQGQIELKPRPKTHA